MNAIRTKLPTVARVLLGLVFFVFGLNGFLQFLPQPPVEGAAAQFLGGLMAAKYLFPLLKGTEVVAGLLLLTGRFVPLALAVLAPIVINIVGFHAALAPAGLGIAFLVLGLELFLAWSYRGAFAPMLAAKVRPGPEAAPESVRPTARHYAESAAE